MAHKPQHPAPTPQDAIRLSLEVGAADKSQRLDRFLADRLPQISRSRLQALLRAGEVSRNKAVVSNGSGKVKIGEIYELRLPASEAPNIAGEDIPLVVLYEDADLIVIDKPKGLAVHPGPGHASGTLVKLGEPASAPGVAKAPAAGGGTRKHGGVVLLVAAGAAGIGAVAAIATGGGE